MLKAHKTRRVRVSAYSIDIPDRRLTCSGWEYQPALLDGRDELSSDWRSHRQRGMPMPALRDHHDRRGGLVLINWIIEDAIQILTGEYCMAHESTKQPEWHAQTAEQVLDHLQVRANGVTSEEAKRRLEHYGPNQLTEALRPTFLQMLWEQLIILW